MYSVFHISHLNNIWYIIGGWLGTEVGVETEEEKAVTILAEKERFMRQEKGAQFDCL